MQIALSVTVSVAGLLSLIILSGGPAYSFDKKQIRALSDQDGLYVELWRGQPRTCEPDSSGFHKALVRHSVNQALFRYSLQNPEAHIDPSGPLLRDDTVTRVEKENSDVLLKAIVSNLRALDSGAHTATIVTDFEIKLGSYSFCSWAILPNGKVIPTKSDVSAAIGCDRPLSVLVREKFKKPARVYVDEVGPSIDLHSVACASYDAGKLLGAISDALLPDEVQQLIVENEINRIAILPVVDLSDIPYWTLVLKDGSALVDHSTIIILPDYDSLFARWPNGGYRPAWPRSAIVIGNPTGDLVGAENEANHANKKMGGTILLTENATLENVIGELGKAEPNPIIYFASHGLSHPGEPLLRSRLRLAGGDLTGDEIASLKLNNAIVVMSACQTALGKVYGGGVLGLARAWYHAGAKQVLMSSWDLGDKSTKILMEKFVDTIVAGKHDVEESLRVAVSKGKHQLGNEGDWSGILMFGIPSER